jgi:hypothetical protein
LKKLYDEAVTAAELGQFIIKKFDGDVGSIVCFHLSAIGAILSTIKGNENGDIRDMRMCMDLIGSAMEDFRHIADGGKMEWQK